jgi:hypothetical protein
MAENDATEAGNESNMQVPLGEVWESFHIEGHKIPFTPIIDSSCTVQARTALVGYGWDNVSVGNQTTRLWLVGE